MGFPCGRVEAAQQAVADEDGDPHHGEVPGERVDRVAHHGLAARGRPLVGRQDAAALEVRAVLERDDLPHVPLPVSPLDHRHAQHDAEHHARRRHREAERDAVLPVERLEALHHAAHGAVPALEAHFEQVAEGRRHAEARREDEAREPEADDVLSPRDELADAELREGVAEDVADLRRHRAEEERREDHVDEEARHLPRRRRVLGRDAVAEAADEHEPDQAADHGARQVEPLQERDVDADDLADEEQGAERAEDDDARHGATTFPAFISASSARASWSGQDVPPRQTMPFSSATTSSTFRPTTSFATPWVFPGQPPMNWHAVTTPFSTS